MTPAELVAAPEWLAHSLDPGRDAILFVRLDAPAIRAASFLDARILSPRLPARWAPAPAIAAAAGGLADDWLGLFHIGHAGSTLLARLLGELPGLRVLREPAALRTLADLAIGGAADWWDEGRWQARAELAGRLWSRPDAPGQRVLLKATSVANTRFAGRASRLPCLFLAVAPEPYLATILGQDGNRAEAIALAPGRVRRLNALLGGDDAVRLRELSEGEWIAAAWACEAGTLAAAASRAGSRALLLDFEALLAAPAATLARAAAHLGVDCPAGQAQALATGPLMARYSKGPEHGYSAQLRAQLLAQARALHAAQIAAGLRWLERAAADHPAIAAALALMGRTRAAAAPAAPAARE